MFLIIQLYLTYRKDCMQSPTREEMMKLRMYDTVADKNDVVIDAQKKRMLNNKLQKGVVKLRYVPTEEQVADVLTKPLSHVKFE